MVLTVHNSHPLFSNFAAVGVMLVVFTPKCLAIPAMDNPNSSKLLAIF
jgi:hypothetical protein